MVRTKGLILELRECGHDRCEYCLDQQWSFIAYADDRPERYRHQAQREAEKYADTVRVLDPRSDQVLYSTCAKESSI